MFVRLPAGNPLSMVAVNGHNAAVITLHATWSSSKACPVWAFVLCVVVAFAPSAKLHIHELDHEPLGGANTLAVLANSSPLHSHATEVHAAANLSHDDHHDGVVTDIEASPKGLTKVLVNVLVMALFVIITLIVLINATGLLYTRPVDSTRSSPARYHLVQPVRAPPL
jgi:beta-lactamase regulating signal transducer with metallopeptidase domain